MLTRMDSPEVVEDSQVQTGEAPSKTRNGAASSNSNYASPIAISALEIVAMDYPLVNGVMKG